MRGHQPRRCDPAQLRTPTRQDQALIYESPKLPAGDHVLKVRVIGDKNPNASHPVVPADRADVFP